MLRLLGNPRSARWLAPARTLKRALGLRPRRRPFDECRRILVIRPDEIGDVVLTSAFFRNLRRSAPKAQITVVTNEVCRPLLEDCPYASEVHALPFKSNLETRYRAQLVVAAIKLKLSRLCRGFDVVFLPRGDADWYNAELVGHLLAGWGTLVTNTAAFIEWTINPPQSPGLADVRYEVKTPQSDALSNLELLKVLGADVADNDLEFWSSAEDRAFAAKWLANGDAQRRKIVFHPPSGRSLLKRWPEGRSRELIGKLIRDTDFEVIVVGGEQDRWVLEELGDVECRRVRLAFNRFSLPELGEVIRQCGFFVGGDTGPMHIAAAVGAKVIGIFGYASEVRFRPWSDKAHVYSLRYHCSPDERGTYEANCMKCIYPENRCLTELSADQVLEKVSRFFEAEAGLKSGVVDDLA